MIDRSEIEAAAARFGVPDSQIIRDHLISHVLAAIGDWPGRGRVTFFGGTALCRTWLPNLRLSEDIDLLVDSPTDGEPLRPADSRPRSSQRGSIIALPVTSTTWRQSLTRTISNVSLSSWSKASTAKECRTKAHTTLDMLGHSDKCSWSDWGPEQICRSL